MKVVNLFKVVENYKGYDITNGAFGLEVFYDGDDFVFNTVDEAEAFIDEITD